MQFYRVLLYMVLVLKYSLPEFISCGLHSSLVVGYNRNLTTYFGSSKFDREEEKGHEYMDEWSAMIRFRRFELSGGSVNVNGMNIYETLLNELGTHNRTGRREWSDTSTAEEGNEGVHVEYEWNARENGRQISATLLNEMVELGTNNSTSRREESVTSAADEGNGGVEVVFEGKARENTFNLSKPEENPYSVLLLMYSSKNSSLGSCTGSLLSASWVLTVAHCVSSRVSHVLVYAGGQDKQEVLDNLPANTSQTLRSLRIYRHPRYSSRKGYDVALIRVDGNFSLTAYVNVIKLSTRPWSHRGYLTCEVTAFGVVRHRKSSADDAARKTHRLRVKKPCYCSYRLRMQAGSRTAERYICTEPKEDYGLCSGDSGSGLVCGGEIRGLTMSLVQMINMEYCILNKWPRRFVCGSRNTLTLFISTCPFLTWINSHVSLFNSTEISSVCVKATASHTVHHNNIYTILTLLAITYELNKITNIVN